MSIGALQRAAAHVVEDRKHEFPLTKPVGAGHYVYAGTPPAITCRRCGRAVYLLNGEVAGTANDTGCAS